MVRKHARCSGMTCRTGVNYGAMAMNIELRLGLDSYIEWCVFIARACLECNFACNFRRHLCTVWIPRSICIVWQLPRESQELIDLTIYASWLDSYGRWTWELANILMLRNASKLQNVDACLHFVAAKFPLTQVGMHYKSNRAAYIIRMTIAFQ